MLKNLNVHEIQISIDGLEDAHDSLRGKGTFRIAIRSIELATESGFEVSVSTMVHPKISWILIKWKTYLKKSG